MEKRAIDQRLDAPFTALRIGIGLTATLAGIDKFFNLLADWGSYVTPLASRLLPMSTATFMGIVGVIEIAVGAAILTRWTRLGGYVASVWLAGVAVNLAVAGFYDVAVRDLVMSVAAFTLARMAEAREAAPVYASARVTGRARTEANA